MTRILLAIAFAMSVYADVFRCDNYVTLRFISMVF